MCNLKTNVYIGKHYYHKKLHCWLAEFRMKFFFSLVNASFHVSKIRVCIFFLLESELAK